MVEIPEAFRAADRVHRTIMMFEGAANLGALQTRERARLSRELNDALDEGRAIARADYEEALRRRVACIKACRRVDRAVRRDPVAAGRRAGARRHRAAPAIRPAARCSRSSDFRRSTMPVGRARNGLPLGMQIAAPAGADDSLVAVARVVRGAPAVRRARVSAR